MIHFCLDMYSLYRKITINGHFSIHFCLDITLLGSLLTILLVDTTCLVLANSADPDQLASEGAN